MQVRVYEQQRLVYSAKCCGPVELGRQSEGEGKPYLRTEQAGHWRIVLAGIDESSVSRKHLFAEPLPDGRVRLTNQSKKLPVRLPDGSELRPSLSQEVALPVSLGIGHRVVHIEPADEGDAESVRIETLAEAPLPPGARWAGLSLLGSANVAGAAPGLLASASMSVGPSMSVESLVGWLHAAMDVLQSAASSTDFFDRAAGVLVDMIGLDAGRVLLRDSGQWRVQALKTAPGRVADDRPPSRQVLGKVLEEKRTFWQTPTTPTEGAASLLGVNALVAAPILDPNGEVIGALYGSRDQGGRGGPSAAGPISRLEATLVELLAGGVAAGLARLEHQQAALQGQKKILQMERDLEIGRDIQAGFLPDELPHLPGWEVAAHFRPAREVSGDFYDAFALPDDHMALVIADVCDKGIGAALFMTLLRSLLRAFAQQTMGRGLLGVAGQHAPPTARPAAGAARRRDTLLADLTALSTVELTNNYVAETHAKACMFATLFFGVLDGRTGSLTYVNAGHDAPAVVGAAGVKARLPLTGPVVGMTPHIAYDIDRVVLEPGDTLLAYTDGVTEARNPAGRFFTEKRLLALLEQPVGSASALLDSVVARLREHVAGADPSDDVTMLAVRRGS
jgi:sigma-B regulation protein RsbU (phosphoserine phosphatase)